MFLSGQTIGVEKKLKTHTAESQGKKKSFYIYIDYIIHFPIEAFFYYYYFEK